ncbi:MAG: GGDEF domain-containing protein, partial [Nitrospirales bacterium]
MSREEEYKHLKGWVKRLGTIDPPTGLLNRYGWLTLAVRHLKRAAYAHQRVGVILAEVDSFQKLTNDLGFEAGEEALQHITEILETHLRIGDLLGRWLEQAFIVLLPGETDGLRVVCERMRKAVETTPLETSKQRLSLTLTLGAASRVVQT